MTKFSLTVKCSLLQIFLMIMAYQSWAQWSGDPSVANTKVAVTTGQQFDQLTIPNGAGGAIVVWNDNRSGFDDIYIDNLSVNGTMLWSATGTYAGVPVVTSAGNQYLDHIIRDAAGNIFVSWDDHRVSTNADVYVQKFNSSGVAQWAANGIKICAAINDQYNARLISDGAGGVIATWADLRNDPLNDQLYEAFAQRIDATGNSLWTPDGVKLTNSKAYSLDLISDGAGGAIISLLDIRNNINDGNGDPTNLDIYAQKISSSGSIVWGAGGIAVCTQSSNQFVDDVITTVSDGSGGAIIYWIDYRSDPGNGLTSNSNGDVYAQRLNSAGAVQWAANGIIISNSLQDVYSLKVIADGAGGAIAAFTEGVTFDNQTLKTQRTNSSGTNLWSNNGITVNSSVSSMQADLALDNNGGVIYTWDKTPSSGAVSQILAHRIDLTTVAFTWQTGGAPVATRSAGARYPSLVTNAMGEAIIVWEDQRNSGTSGTDLYAAKVMSNGLLPLQWGNITATLKGSYATLNWETLQETNTKEFEVLRSVNGSAFVYVGKVKAVGNSMAKTTYEFLDKDALTFAGSKLNYQIKQFDNDGRYSYSRVVSIFIPGKTLHSRLITNPVLTQARVLYIASVPGNTMIRVLDGNGRAVMQQNNIVIEGMNQLTMNVSTLPKGIYHLHIKQGTSTLVLRMVK